MGMSKTEKEKNKSLDEIQSVEFISGCSVEIQRVKNKELVKLPLAFMALTIQILHISVN